MSETNYMSAILTAAADCPAPVYGWQDEAADAVSALVYAHHAYAAGRIDEAVYGEAIDEACALARYAYNMAGQRYDAREEACYLDLWSAVHAYAETCEVSA